jgi:hypothetical protein
MTHGRFTQSGKTFNGLRQYAGAGRGGDARGHFYGNVMVFWQNTFRVKLFFGGA